MADDRKQRARQFEELFVGGTWEEFRQALEISALPLPPREHVVFDEERRALVQKWVDTLKEAPADAQVELSAPNSTAEAALGGSEDDAMEVEMEEDECFDEMEEDEVTEYDSISEKAAMRNRKN